MTPQERQLIDDLFGRLAKVEGAPRDPDAVAAIAQAQRQAPNAIYALVQTVLVQDEALKRADARIQELEGDGAPAQPQGGGFLDSMRDALFGQNQPPSRGSVPPSGGRPAWNTGQVMGQPQGGQYGQPPMDPRQQMGQAPYGQAPAASGGGGSFLGTAAAAAAGVVGGGLLMNSIRGMMGGGHQQGFGDASAGDSRSHWSSGSSGNNDLARDAGVNDIGRNDGSRAGAFDQAQADADQDQDQDQDDGDMDMGDFDDGDGGGSDYA